MWEFWNPRGDGSCEATTPNMTTLHDFHGWHNLRGVEIETGKVFTDVYSTDCSKTASIPSFFDILLVAQRIKTCINYYN